MPGMTTPPDTRDTTNPDVIDGHDVRQVPAPGDERPLDDTHDANLDRTIEDSFPASDPPSTIPDPDDQRQKD